MLNKFPSELARLKDGGIRYIDKTTFQKKRGKGSASELQAFLFTPNMRGYYLTKQHFNFPRLFGSPPAPHPKDLEWVRQHPRRTQAETDFEYARAVPQHQPMPVHQGDLTQVGTGYKPIPFMLTSHADTSAIGGAPSAGAVWGSQLTPIGPPSSKGSRLFDTDYKSQYHTPHSDTKTDDPPAMELGHEERDTHHESRQAWEIFDAELAQQQQTQLVP